MKQKTYRVPVSWQMYGWVTVQSDTRQHAAEIAESDMGIGLPDNGTYVEGSWEVDWEIVEDDTSDEMIERHRGLVISDDGTVKELL